MENETTACKLVDRYLLELYGILIDLDQVKFVMGIKIDAIAEAYRESIERLEERKGFLEKMVENLVKKHRVTILGDKDRADLKNGSVMLKEEKRVKRIRKMLENLKAAGMTDAVKSEEVVDWDKVDKFSDETLATLGTKRVPKDIFSYEIRKVITTKSTKDTKKSA